MSKASVYDKILLRGQEESDEIIRLGQEKAKSITERALNETDIQVKKIISDANIRSKDLIITKKAELEQQTKQEVLSEQKGLIKEAFKKALYELQKMNDTELIKYVKKYIQINKLSGNEEIIVNKKDFERYKRLFSSNKSLTLDLLGNFTLSTECANITGGFIISSKYYDVDNSFESVLTNLEESLETEVAGILFKGGK